MNYFSDRYSVLSDPPAFCPFYLPLYFHISIYFFQFVIAIVIQVGSPHYKCEFEGCSRRWSDACPHSQRNAGGTRGEERGLCQLCMSLGKRECMCVCVVRWNGMALCELLE